jgi:hypothetical protein
MTINRRKTLQSFLFGAGYLGLRSLATGIPVAVLARGPRALAATPTLSNPQYFIISTSGLGDPINVNSPGTYATNLVSAGLVHNPDATQMPATAVTVGSTQTTAALPWASTAAGGQLPASALSQMSVWHIATETPVHPKEPDVLKLMDSTQANEMLPSLLSAQLAPALGTIQPQPISLGAISPSEALSFQGQTQPIIPPTALAATLTSQAGPLTNLQKLRDQTLSQIDDIYRNTATLAQRRYIDSLVISQGEVRNINQNLLSMLSNIGDNSVSSQIIAALALIQMNVSPVMTIHIPFGGDNHGDLNLATEATETVSAMQSIAQLWTSIPSSLQGKVSFFTLNVFGRTALASNMNGTGGLGGRNHNPNWQTSIFIGSGIKPGIIGGVQAPASNALTQDFQAMPIVSTSGAASASGDVQPTESLPSFGKTLLASIGVDSGTVNSLVTTGTTISGVLSSSS